MILLLLSLFLFGLAFYAAGYFHACVNKRREVERAHRQADKFERLADRWCGIAEREQGRADEMEAAWPTADYPLPNSADKQEREQKEGWISHALAMDEIERTNSKWRPLDAKHADPNKRKYTKKPDPLDADHIG